MNKIVALVGMAGSGKSVMCDCFIKAGYEKIYFGGVTMDYLKEHNLEVTAENEKMVREKLRKDYGMGAYALLLIPKIEKTLESGNVVLDGLYSWDEYVILKEKFPSLIVVSAIVDKNIRYDRLSKRDIRGLTNDEALKRDLSEIENLKKGGPIAFADYYVLNNSDIDTYVNDIEKIINLI